MAFKCDCCGESVTPRYRSYGFCNRCWLLIRYNQDPQYRQRNSERSREWERKNPEKARRIRERYLQRHRGELREKAKKSERKRQRKIITQIEPIDKESIFHGDFVVNLFDELYKKK